MRDTQIWIIQVLTSLNWLTCKEHLETTSQQKPMQPLLLQTNKSWIITVYWLRFIHAETRFWMLFTCLTRIHFWFRISQNGVKFCIGNLSLIKTLCGSLGSCHVSTVRFSVTQGRPKKTFWVSRTFCFWNWRKHLYMVSIFMAQSDRTSFGQATRVARNKPVSRTYPVKNSWF